MTISLTYFGMLKHVQISLESWFFAIFEVLDRVLVDIDELDGGNAGFDIYAHLTVTYQTVVTSSRNSD